MRLVGDDVKSNSESTIINTASGVSLDLNKRTLVGSVLDVSVLSAVSTQQLAND